MIKFFAEKTERKKLTEQLQHEGGPNGALVLVSKYWCAANYVEFRLRKSTHFPRTARMVSVSANFR